MATDPSDISLTREQRSLLANRADETGRDWQELLQESLGHVVAEAKGTAWQESFLTKAKCLGAVGMVKGTPADLLTNPKYFDGFGSD